MEPLYEKLIGALIGLARATDGNDHLITTESTSAIVAGLTADSSDAEDLKNCLSRAEAAKRNMVPDCFLCANPYGRTSAYDLRRIEEENADIRDTKYRILRNLRTLAAMELDPSRELLLYRGLVALGLEGYTVEELHSVFPTDPE